MSDLILSTGESMLIEGLEVVRDDVIRLGRPRVEDAMRCDPWLRAKLSVCGLDILFYVPLCYC